MTNCIPVLACVVHRPSVRKDGTASGRAETFVAGASTSVLAVELRK